MTPNSPGEAGQIIKMDILAQTSLSSVEDPISNTHNVLRFGWLQLRASTDPQVDGITAGAGDGDVAGLDAGDVAVAGDEVVTGAGEVTDNVGWQRWGTDLASGDAG